ncbi:hypothetical protein B296_00040832 [Ensete ventricosum]|uniref:Uncharacterized protein n=1 Tax=Ensete ventricosum TaxID=4639 RepID=A0A426XED0_ENSVE|nr:hypothetical protein B296_00040832 [Ensete ventricosum]
MALPWPHSHSVAPALAVTLATSRPSSVDNLCACALGLNSFPLQQQFQSYATCSEQNCSHIHFIVFVDFGI